MAIDSFFRENLLPSGFAIQRAKDHLTALRRGETGLSSGLSQLDQVFRMLPTELTTIGARSGTGKTAFGMQLVHAVLMQLKQSKLPGCVAVFSAEMAGEKLMLREACAQENISLWRVDTGECKDAEYTRLERRLDELDSARLLIDESSAPTLEHMVGQLNAVSGEQVPIRLVVFDYTELAGEFDRQEPQRIAKISRGLKAIARRFHCPVVALSQLNRDIEARSEKRPSMRDLMHGGEREPDRILIMVRPWLYDRNTRKELVNLYVVKNRNGPLGDYTLAFDEVTMRFRTANVYRRELNGDN